MRRQRFSEFQMNNQALASTAGNYRSEPRDRGYTLREKMANLDGIIWILAHGRCLRGPAILGILGFPEWVK